MTAVLLVCGCTMQVDHERGDRLVTCETHLRQMIVSVLPPGAGVFERLKNGGYTVRHYKYLQPVEKEGDEHSQQG